MEDEAAEGDACTEEGCIGRLSFKIENCTCFQVAPCSACMNAVLHCPECEARDRKETIKRREMLEYMEVKGW